MPFNSQTPLWQNKTDSFFPEEHIDPIQQEGAHCVSTSLAMLTGESPEYFQKRINTQDPVSWSEALRPLGRKLAYCPADIRRIEFYLDELITYNDLFALCYYKPDYDFQFLDDPRDDGWIGGSHSVLLHRDQIIDPAKGKVVDAWEHDCPNYHTKRIFRVVPADHPRGV